MKSEIKIFETTQILAESLANEFQIAVRNSAANGKSFYVALSGGNTPKLFLETLVNSKFNKNILWHNIHLFWGDERNVPPDDKESNFGMTKRALIDHIEIPLTNIHRIHGEENPFIEVTNYSREIKKVVPFNNSEFPKFDWIFLGLGDDGHTASIFPNSNVIIKKHTICSVAKHPISGQERITLTLPVINKTKRVSFLVTGEGKAEILRKIVMNEKMSEKFPAALVKPENGILEWYLDKDAGKYL